MRSGSIFLTLAIPAVILLTVLLIDNTKQAHTIIDQKELHTKANEMSRKPYVIQRYDDMICAERIERTARQMAYIEEYCKGGMFMGLWPPDSLKKEIHYEMEAMVDSMARLEGYGGW